MKLNLNLGISISLPVDWNFVKPEYSNEPSNKNEFDNIKIEPIFNKFNSLQIMFSKYNLSKLDISNIKKFIKKIKYKYVYIA